MPGQSYHRPNDRLEIAGRWTKGMTVDYVGERHLLFDGIGRPLSTTGSRRAYPEGLDHKMACSLQFVTAKQQQA